MSPLRKAPAATLLASGLAALVLAGCTAAPAAPGPSVTPRTAAPAPAASPSQTPAPQPGQTPTPDPTTAPPAPPTVAVPPAVPKPEPRRISGDRLAFASPTGNLLCVMTSADGADCHAIAATWSGASVPRSRQLSCGPEFGEFGPGQDVLVKADGAWGECVSEAHQLAAVLRDDTGASTWGAEYRTWFDPKRDKTVRIVFGDAVVLPYGGKATTGRYTCTMAETGVICTNTRTGAGFTLSRTRLTIR